MKQLNTIAVLTVGFALCASACNKQSDAENPESAEAAEEGMDGEGPMEEAGEWTDEAAEDSAEAVEEAADDTADEFDDNPAND